MFEEFFYVWIFLIVVILFLIILITFKKTRKSAWKNKARVKLKQLNSLNSDPKLKVLELDKLMEFVLQNYFSTPQSIGSILKLKAGKIDKFKLNQIWKAHKLRNDLAHRIDFSPTKAELEEAKAILIKYIFEFSS